MHIPIIGNGDVTTAAGAKECFERYGVDAIMIGRGSIGRPWIFREVKHYLETGEELPRESFEWYLDVLREEVLNSVARLDERRGIIISAVIWQQLPYLKESPISVRHALPCYAPNR